MRAAFVIERIFYPMPHDALPLVLQSIRAEQELMDVYGQLARTLLRCGHRKTVVAPFVQNTRNGAVRVWLATPEMEEGYGR